MAFSSSFDYSNENAGLRYISRKYMQLSGIRD
jgi:hypothetical protein